MPKGNQLRVEIERVDSEDVKRPRFMPDPVSDQIFARDSVGDRTALRIDAMTVRPRFRCFGDRFDRGQQRDDLRIFAREQCRGGILINDIPVARHLHVAAGKQTRAQLLFSNRSVTCPHPIQPRRHFRRACCIGGKLAGAQTAAEQQPLGIGEAIHFFQNVGKTHRSKVGAPLSQSQPRHLKRRHHEMRPTNPLTLKIEPPSLPALFHGTEDMKTFSAKANEVKRQWWIIDAADQVLGRVAVKAANLLRGKEKPIYTSHVDTGDFVIVINAAKVRVTGKKEEQKTYMSFSGFVGGHKTENFKARRARRPTLLVERAVKGMIPHNRLGRSTFTKLKVYSGADHPHVAQAPTLVTEIK